MALVLVVIDGSGIDNDNSCQCNDEDDYANNLKVLMVINGYDDGSTQSNDGD